MPNAMRAAFAINPMNRPANVTDPARLALLATKWWGADGVNLTVSFMDSPTAALKNKILSYANEWGKYGNIKFSLTNGTGQIRISRGAGGYYSYLGVDILQIPRSQHTMNLEGFTERTSDEEVARVVIHEFGHSLGAAHEHMRREIVNRIDRRKAIAYFARIGWTAQDVDQQVMTPLEEASIRGLATPEADEISVMTYELPGSIMKDGVGVIGGRGLSSLDIQWIGRIYPKADVPPPPPEGEKTLVIKYKGELTIPGWRPV